MRRYSLGILIVLLAVGSTWGQDVDAKAVITKAIDAHGGEAALNKYNAGVTKVIQVCAPNGGSPLAELGVTKSAKPFVECLTADYRKKCLEERANKFIPEKVQFVCVIARTNKKSDTDGVVPCDCQWTADLHKQGISAISVLGGHRDVVRDAKLAGTLAGLVREPQERWSAERVEKGKKEIFGK